MATPENMDESSTAALLDPPKVPNTADVLTGTKTKKYRVMVIPKGTSHEFWKTIHAGALKAAEDLGNCEIIWQGPQKEDDRSAQIALVESAIAAKVDGIVIAPLDSRTLVPPVERAIDAGIPVVILDSRLESEKPVAMVATNNYNGGVLGAERLAAMLGGKGRIILLRYATGSAATEERERGFTDTIRKYPEITYLSDNQYAGATADSAQKVAQTLVVRFRDQVDGIFCPNESSTAGMLRSLLDAGLLSGR
jgi:ribose transport system substrate-binding protein